MEAKKLYNKLDSDFELDLCKDDWTRMDFNDYVSDNFKTRYMGILLDNSEAVNFVYTASSVQKTIPGIFKKILGGK